MKLKRYGQLFGLLYCTGLSTTVAAEAVFSIWIEAPEQVVAGETFTASVWAEVSGSVLDDGTGAMYTFRADLHGFGVNTQFSNATIPYMITFSQGVPETNALRDVAALNSHYIPGQTISTRNPMKIFDVDVTTANTGFGSLELSLAPVEGLESILTWWVDYFDQSFIYDTDPGSSRIITPATVRVVPGQGGVAVLAVAGLAAVRRRR